MKLPLHIAKSLLALSAPESKMPGSMMKHPVVSKLIEDGLLQKQQISKSKSYIYLPKTETLAPYLHNNFGVNNLHAYISGLEDADLNRSVAVSISGNSKLKTVRTFKGFLVNSYEPVSAILNKQAMLIHPPQGSFVYISDYEQFEIDAETVVVGIENAENFSKIQQQRYLFKDVRVLFVSRYPQSNDLIKWLMKIPNRYLHFGDLDFAGISIYLSEFKVHLGEKAGYFVPENTEELLMQFGNRTLFNKQYKANAAYINDETEEAVCALYKIMLRHKKVLEQEIFIV